MDIYIIATNGGKEESVIDKELKKLLKEHLNKLQDVDIGFSRYILVVILEQYISFSERDTREGYLSKLRGKINEVKKIIQEDEKYELDSELKKGLSEFVGRNFESFDGLSIGKLYETMNTIYMKKKRGQVFTPEEVVDYMVEEVDLEETMRNNSDIKVLDPSCGAGIFLVKLYRKIESLGEVDSPQFKKSILKDMLYGVDTDFFSVFMAKASLIMESKLEIEPNIGCQDILIQDCHRQFDIIIGNPPYIGAKNLDKEYKSNLREMYSEVYQDKSDISYCFFKRGHDLLRENGRLEIITSRYFLEALYATKLRSYIKEKYTLEKILDFYGENVFKGISISPLIVKLKKGVNDNSKIEYHRPNDSWNKKDLVATDSFDCVEVDKSNLSKDTWVMKSQEETELFKKIDKLGDISLKEIAFSSQGMITGLDKAFILENKEDLPERERHVLKNWIKNSEIKKYKKISPSKYIINTGFIKDLDEFPHIKRHLEKYKDKLQRRRECRLGMRSWHDIQWSRGLENFSGERILFPYKSSKNSFTLTREEIYHSADIYSLKLKQEYKEKIPVEYLLGFLNSSLFEYYFKIVAKKLNRSIYEYYPNKMMGLKLKLPEDREMQQVACQVKRLIGKEFGKEEILKKVDKMFFEIYGLNSAERELIINYIDIKKETKMIYYSKVYKFGD